MPTDQPATAVTEKAALMPTDQPATAVTEKAAYSPITDSHLLPWARWPWQCCRARVEPNPSGMWGQCELRRGHDGDHALERGFDTPRWSTRWTA